MSCIIAGVLQKCILCVQVIMAIIARLSLHIMYEFTAFMNVWAVEVLKVSGGVAAQVGTFSIASLCSAACSAAQRAAERAVQRSVTSII